MFLVGAETTTSPLNEQWLNCNPKTLMKAKHEILKVVGKNKRFEESDIDNVTFLQAIVKENLRLHPPGPLVLRKATKDTNFMGYDIPKTTHVLINLWAIGKDPENWSDPLSFKPKRICPGLQLAHRLLHLHLGSLLHQFDWELEDSFPFDMSEKMGMTVRKLKPLREIPTKSSF
ncbi:oxygenase [Lithospermum erythrorhizon]|uniref:Oxygenase n=1 Tax=Lithospermum erythrorhizon TaxID=34254 RepID=A0AAV3PCE2_LITER